MKSNTGEVTFERISLVSSPTKLGCTCTLCTPCFRIPVVFHYHYNSEKEIPNREGRISKDKAEGVSLTHAISRKFFTEGCPTAN